MRRKIGSRGQLLARMPDGQVGECTHDKGEPFTPTSDKITIVIRCTHPEPTNTADIHVDDICPNCLDKGE